MAVPPQHIHLKCPSCQAPISMVLHELVDADQDPQLKHQLLGGQLNVAVCSSCHMRAVIASPLVYHQASKQLCFVFFPPELQLSPQDQERYIGEMTNRILATLPADTPRGYLLTPRRFLSLTSLIDAVLEMDGVPRNVIQKQRSTIDLISQLAECLDQEERLTPLVNQYRDALDYEFFLTLSAFIEASEKEGRQETAQMLNRLRERLLQVSGFDGGGGAVELEAVFRKLEEAPEEQLQETIANVRHLITDDFYQQWRTRIEGIGMAGEKERAQTLLARLAQVIRMVEQMDQEASAVVEQHNAIIQEAVDAPDPAEVLQRHSEHIREAFLMVLEARIQAALRAEDQHTLARLETIKRIAIEIIQSLLPPDERLINSLMMATTPEERRALLQQHRELVTPGFVKKLNELANEQEKQKDTAMIASHLRQIAREAGAMVF